MCAAQPLKVSRRRRVWNALGTTRASQIVTVLVIVYFLVIGMLVFGYVQVSSCLAEYANKSARATEARSQAAAQDRELNEAEARLDAVDRQRLRANDEALASLLGVLGTQTEDPDHQKMVMSKFRTLISVTNQSTAIYEGNMRARAKIQQQRVVIERARSANPVPPPPSDSC